MDICTNCNGKGYNTVFVGAGGYTDFGPREYIETTPLGIQKIPCKKCKKEDITEVVDYFLNKIQQEEDINNKKILKNRTQIIPNIEDEGIFQLTPYGELRWDSPISVSIPKGIRNQWYVYNQKNMNEGRYELCFDIDESAGCKLISIEHLKAIVMWRDKSTEKEDIDLSI